MAWSLAFCFFTLAAGFFAAGMQNGWNEAIFRGFYLFGAIVNVPFLALGTILLKCAPKTGRLAIIIVGTFAIFSAGVMASAPFLAPLPVDGLAQGSDVFGALPRTLAAVGSGLGALVVFIGALTTALRHRSLALALGNFLIAAGTLVSGASGLFNSVADAMTAFSVTLLLGIVLIFMGFLFSTSIRPLVQPSPGKTQ